MSRPNLDEHALNLDRTCHTCGQPYKIAEFADSEKWIVFRGGHKYLQGCEKYCLACWLGVGPLDLPTIEQESSDPALEQPVNDPVEPEEFWIAVDSGISPEFCDDDPDHEEGDLLTEYEAIRSVEGCHLVVMPIARVHIDWLPIRYPGGYSFYTDGMVNLDALNIIPNKRDSGSLAEACSEASGITQEVLDHHPLVVFPCRFEWESFLRSSHRSRLEFIRDLSESVDSSCLDFARYRLCRLDPIDCLPGRAGQTMDNPMMAGALLYNPHLHEGRIIGGDAFTHYLTRGLGLPLEPIEHTQSPKYGEVGHIIQHALSLYTALLESSNPTARFMQALGLLEFLASPEEYQQFKEVKKVIARYVARDHTEYQHLLDRFFELTGKKDPTSGRIIGFRTRIVHMGERIERIVPGSKRRKQLFLELDGYIRPVIDHMIQYSGMALPDYLRIRETLKPYEN